MIDKINQLFIVNVKLLRWTIFRINIKKNDLFSFFVYQIDKTVAIFLAETVLFVWYTQFYNNIIIIEQNHVAILANLLNGQPFE